MMGCTHLLRLVKRRHIYKNKQYWLLGRQNKFPYVTNTTGIYNSIPIFKNITRNSPITVCKILRGNVMVGLY